MTMRAISHGEWTAPVRYLRNAMGGVSAAARVVACVALVACGSPKTTASTGSAHPEPCFGTSAANPPPPSQSPVPVPDVGLGRVTLTIEGRQVHDEVIDNALAGAKYRANLDPRLFGASTRPAADLLTLQRGAVAGIVLHHMEICQGVRDSIKPDRAKAVADGRAQVASYADALRAFAHPSPVPPPQQVPIPGASPARYATVGPLASSPIPPPPVPGGLTPEQYYLSEGFIQADEATQVRRAEEARILKATVGSPSRKALGEWMRHHLIEYSVRVEGLGDFSLPDAYEASGPA